MSKELHDLYQEIILDHNKHPRSYGALVNATHRAEGYNPLCGDKIEVYLRIQDERVEAIQFEAASCAICKASASMMMEALIGKKNIEGESVYKEVVHILKAESKDPTFDAQSELSALAGVRKFPARIKCAMLPWHTYQAALRGEAKTVVESGL